MYPIFNQFKYIILLIFFANLIVEKQSKMYLKILKLNTYTKKSIIFEILFLYFEIFTN